MASRAPFLVSIRWRPQPQDSLISKSISYSATRTANNHSIAITTTTQVQRSSTWKSNSTFDQIFPETATNKQIYISIVLPKLPRVLNGATCNFFAYGHSGSGKTHTIMGYEHDIESANLGLCLAATRDLFTSLDEINSTLTPGEDERAKKLGIAVRLYEVRSKNAYDLLNGGKECHIREDADGKVHVRGQTEILEGGIVRVQPIVATACWSFQQLRRTVLEGLAKRAVGSSTVHAVSSRTHAILELEVINEELTTARQAVIDRESELVPIGKRATDIYIEEQMKSLLQDPEGKWIPNPHHSLDQARIDTAEAEKNEYVLRVKTAEGVMVACFENSKQQALGGKLVFVDLAGSEYFDQAKSVGTKGANRPNQTMEEQRQGRQINTDLFALKEVIRARANGQTRIPYRSSPLTMVLRSHFEADETGGQSAMILTVSPAEEQVAATLNTLKYGDLVGRASS